MLLGWKALHLLYPSSFLHSISLLQPQSLFLCPSKCFLNIHVLSVSMASSPVHLLLREELALTVTQFCIVEVSNNSADIPSSPTTLPACALCPRLPPFSYLCIQEPVFTKPQRPGPECYSDLCTCSSWTVSLSPKLCKFFVLFSYSSSKVLLLSFFPSFSLFSLLCYQWFFHRSNSSSVSF